MLIFTDPPSSKVYGLYTFENVEIYGHPLTAYKIYVNIRWQIFFKTL